MEPISTSNSTVRLLEYLQEQQEPFNLEAYLLERGYKGNKTFYSEGSVGCFFSKSKFLRRSARKRKKITNPANKCSEIRKVLCKKLVSIGKVIKLRRRRIGDGEFDVKSLSSGSSSTEDTSTSMDASQTHIESSHQANELVAEGVIQWRIIEENKQCSPDSVLDEIEASPIQNVGSNREREHPSSSNPGLSKKPTEDSIFSATLWDLIIRREKPSIFTSDDTSFGYISSKKALQQTRQLLFDCVREAVESRGRQRKTGHLMEPEKLGKIVCDKMQVWNRRSANEKKITRLLRSEFLGFFQEWENLEGFRGDIVKEVGDQILEQIKDEMVEEVIGFYIF